MTRRTEIGKNSDGKFAWAPHKTVTSPVNDGYEAQGLGAGLSTSVKLGRADAVEHGQLRTLSATIPPQYVDATRPDLPEPPDHFRGVKGAYVLPAALLGLPVEPNRLYLPTSALAELKTIQADMINLAQDAPSSIRVQTTFGDDGLADSVSLIFDSLDRITGAPVHRILWKPQLAPDRTQWHSQETEKSRSSGVRPPSSVWQTWIKWDKPTKDGDGVHVVANLGPDHPLGSTPSNETAAARVQQLRAAAGDRENYIAGHLLNDHLGGPGNLAANLTPIPGKANSQMASSIEKPAKDIVNDEHGWIRYEVTVSHAHDAVSNVDYPSQIDAHMSIFDSKGDLQNPTHATIAIAAPSSFGAGTAAAPKAAGKLAGTAIETSPVRLDEVILSHEDDLRPFLRSSAELFQLVLGSGLNTNVDDPRLTEALRNILALLNEYETHALPQLNLIRTITDAVKQWQDNPAARAYLRSVPAGVLQQALRVNARLADTFSVRANLNLQQAGAALTQPFSPALLYRESPTLALQFVDHASPDVPLLDILVSAQHATVPSRVEKRKRARTDTDVDQDGEKEKGTLDEQEELHFRDRFRAQPRLDESVPTPSSPLSVFEEYGRSAHEIETKALYNKEFVSARMLKVVDTFIALIHNDDAPICDRLRKDSLLSTSVALQAIVEQVAHLIDAKKANSYHSALESSNRLIWGITLNHIATHEPSVALRLLELLGLVS